MSLMVNQTKQSTPAVEGFAIAGIGIAAGAVS
jgi:hypothetical protein